MASSSKTSNLGLNIWSGTDKPRRTDFVEDNNIIDEALGGHLADSERHLTAAEREKLNAPVSAVSYSGTGTSARTLSFGFSPSFAVVFKRFDAFNTYNSVGGYTKINGAFFSSKETSDDCGGISGSTLTVKQSTSASDGIFYNLNEQYGQYVAVAFR